MSKIHKETHIKGEQSIPEFDVGKVRAMSDAEAEKRAKSDPDSPIITPASLKSMKPIKRYSHSAK
jgi:hypothetical protein